MRFGRLMCFWQSLLPHSLCRFTTANAPANRQMPIASVVMGKCKNKRKVFMTFTTKQTISTLIMCILTLLYSNKVKSQDFSSFIKGIENYKRSVKFNKSFTDIDSTTFNLKEYLEKFDKIKVRKGYLIDCKYFDNYLDGKPYFYAKSDSFVLENYLKQETLKCISIDTVYNQEIKINHSVPFDFLNKIEKVKEYKIHYNTDSFNIVHHRKLYEFLTDSVNRGYNYMLPIDDKEGYFQYLYFKEFGERFCTKWHEAYNSKRIILNQDEVSKLVKSYSRDEFCEKSEYKKLKKIKSINPNPQIELSDNYCRITLIEVGFNGIYKRLYRINRSFPYSIKIEDENQLVRICPNIIF